MFFGKILYFLLMIVCTAKILDVSAESGAQFTLHLLLFLSIIGAMANTYIFNPTKDKYYAWIRLRELVKVNLLPSSVIGAGLALLLYATGGTDHPLNYVVLFVSVVVLSIFFSVHYLTLYYLLQPYNAGTEIKSGTYQLMTGGTYIVCYLMLQIKMPTLIFGMMTIAFCVIYCIVASTLVYMLAPKTFRIRA